MLSILYNLLSHIYDPVWLVIIFEYLFYFILLVFLFQVLIQSLKFIHI